MANTFPLTNVKDNRSLYFVVTQFEFHAKAWRVVIANAAKQSFPCVDFAERFFAKRMNATTTEIKGSHVIFISQPEKVADVIKEAANNAVKQ